MLQTDANPEGLPRSVFDGLRAGVERDRSQFYKDLSAPFYGANRGGSMVSQGLRDAFWLMSMQIGFKGRTTASGSSPRPTSPTQQEDRRTDPDHPGRRRAHRAHRGLGHEILQPDPNNTFNVYRGAPHGLFATHQDQFNADLLAFLKGDPTHV
jgi:non-heme chloroperoxidase